MVQSNTDNTLESFINNFGLQLDTARSSWSSRWSEAVCRGWRGPKDKQAGEMEERAEMGTHLFSAGRLWVKFT